MGSRPVKTGVVVTLLMILFAVYAVAQNNQPTLNSIEPDRVKAFSEFQLVLKGAGFQEKSVVYVQVKEEPARYMKHAPSFVSENELKIGFKFGLGLKPRERSIYVKNPDGERSNKVKLTVVPPHEPLVKEEPVSDETGAETPKENTDTKPDDDAGSTEEKGDDAENTEAAENAVEIVPPQIKEIQPLKADAGIRFSLVVLGEGFQEGAVVMVMANVKAGTYFKPKYEFQEFSAEFLGDTILEVTFDRGFYHDPSSRELYVVNPDGGESNKVALTVVPVSGGK